MAAITLEGVTTRYPVDSKYDGVTDVSLRIRDGEYFCLVGPAGSGTTSVLRAIAGLDAPERGEVRFDDDVMTDVPPNERGASMLFENLALYPNRTGYGNVGHPLEVAGVPEADRRERVEAIAERLGIGHLLDRTPDTFSGGEKQRVGIARTIVRESDVYLLTEPLGGLDAKLRRQLRVLLKRLHEDVEGTFVHATQNQAEAMSVADRIAVFRDGRLQQIGTPTELYDRPATRFVAEYVGSPRANFLDGSVDAGRLAFGPFAVDAPSGVASGGYVVGVRPRDVRLRRDPSPDAVEGTVDVTEPLGADTIVDVDLGAVRLRTVCRQDWAHDLTGGSTVFVTIGPDDVYLIDPDSEAVVHAPPRS
jgi:ABC-type sugar transport system ATPase subunit